MTTYLPPTVDTAVSLLFELMPASEQTKVAQVEEEHLERLHLGMGI